MKPREFTKALEERPILLVLRRNGLVECEGCGEWVIASKRAREFHENRCEGSAYAAQEESK